MSMTQAEYWNKVAGPNWVVNQRLLDATLEPFGQSLIERADLSHGLDVVDVGCGCGGTTLEISRRCGKARGLDISRPMLALARRRARDCALPAEFVEADASCYQPGERSFDRVVSRFGIMFFASPEQAFVNMRAWLKPSGKLAAICWQGPAENPWLTLPTTIARRYIAAAEPDSESAAPFSLADAGVLRGLLASAGFRDVRLEDCRHPMRISGDIEHAYRFFIDRGPVAAMLLSAAGPERDAAIAAIEADIATRYDGTGVELDAASWIVEATAGP